MKRKIFPAGLLRVEVDFGATDEPVVYISALDTEGIDEQAIVVMADELGELMAALQSAELEISRRSSAAEWTAG